MQPFLPLTALLLTAAPAVALSSAGVRGSELLAIQVAVAETGDGTTLEHAVILIEKGRIVTIGEDLPIERGIPILDRDPEWTVTPGFVNAYSRLGLDSRAGSEFKPDVKASVELYPEDDSYRDVLEFGVTTLGLYPPGTTVAGQASVIRTSGKSREEMIWEEGAYLKVGIQASSSSKKALTRGFEKADQYEEKVKKAREKWEKDNEKKSKSKSTKKDDKAASPPDDDDKDKDKKEDGVFVPPAPDADVVPFLKLRSGELRALVAINGAAEYLHFLDAMGEEKFEWHLRCPITRELDLFYVKDKIGEKGCKIVFEPTISVHPGTMRQRNLPAEFSNAGADLVLIPRDDDVGSHERWREDDSVLMSTGLTREKALRAMTLAPAELLGVGDETGSLTVGKRADMVFFNGDPFDTGTKVVAVMVDGQFVVEGDEQ